MSKRQPDGGASEDLASFSSCLCSTVSFLPRVLQLNPKMLILFPCTDRGESSRASGRWRLVLEGLGLGLSIGDILSALPTLVDTSRVGHVHSGTT